MVKLELMNDFDFQRFLDSSIDSYAEEKAKAGNWKESEAYEKSKQEFNRLLPDGRSTQDHLLYTIFNKATDEKVGSLWIYIQTEVSRAFIYEITIQEELQGKGFGTKAIEELEKVLQDKGIDELALHVFGHNKKAIRLYERLGFETTNVNMKKSLTSN